ncbi:hypothetical protein, partial [Candidatus Kryptonium thompsonii]|uniref:hypothetical protein n=1 Tax=Candidatus Kryptonium thompsonii TaxID=1633631 RepID=UPI00159EC3CB
MYFLSKVTKGKVLYGRYGNPDEILNSIKNIYINRRFSFDDIFQQPSIFNITVISKESLDPAMPYYSP